MVGDLPELLKEPTEKSSVPLKKRSKEFYKRYSFFVHAALVFIALDSFLLLLVILWGAPPLAYPIALLLLMGGPFSLFLLPNSSLDILTKVIILLICLSGTSCYFLRPRKWWAKIIVVVSLFLWWFAGVSVFGYGV